MPHFIMGCSLVFTPIEYEQDTYITLYNIHYIYMYIPEFESTIICIRSIHSVFYPLGCMAGYKLDDDILA